MKKVSAHENYWASSKYLEKVFEEGNVWVECNPHLTWRDGNGTERRGMYRINSLQRLPAYLLGYTPHRKAAVLAAQRWVSK